MPTDFQNANLRTIHTCVYHCAQLLYTAQHRTILIIFTPKFQTIITAQMPSVGDEWAHLL